MQRGPSSSRRSRLPSSPLEISNEPSSLSSGSSGKSCKGDFVKLTGDSGVVPNDELDWCQSPWLRLEKVGVTGVEEVDAPEDSRECDVAN